MPLVSGPRLFVCAAFAAALLASCSSSPQPQVPGASTLAEASGRGSFGVGVTTMEFVDTSRPLEAQGDFVGAAERPLTVEVWYPSYPSAASPEERDAPLDASGAPYPLVFFSHGFSSFARQSASFTQHLASHGYIVVAPTFPLSNINAPGRPHIDAVLNQPGDISFLIDSFASPTQGDAGFFKDAINFDAIGVTGHSLGGLTALLTAFGPERDGRVKAVAPIAAPACFIARDTVAGQSLPLLVLGGSLDRIVGRASIRNAYDVANAPRYFVELAGADHTRFADIDIDDRQLQAALPGIFGDDVASDAQDIAEATGAEAAGCAGDDTKSDDGLLPADRQRELLRIFATPFFDAYLKGSAEAEAFLQDELPGLVPEASVEIDVD